MNLSDRDRIALDRIKQRASEFSTQNNDHTQKLSLRMTINDNLLYGCTETDKELIYHHLKKKFEKTQITDDHVFRGKNLLYFSVFLDDEYIKLAEMSLASILKNTSDINFDVLFITDVSTYLKIKQFPIISKFNVDYFIVPTPKSPPLASIKKLLIFEYPRINEYEKILFLDADTVCIKNLNIIFDTQLESERIYVSHIPVESAMNLLSPTHGLMYLTDEDAYFLYKNPDILAFNAGQFLFLNSSRMRMHFENVKWLQSVWPCKYFYEQSVMNYYFVFNQLTSPLVDSSGNYLISVTFNLPSNLKLEAIKKLENVKPSRLVVSGATNSNFSEIARPRVNAAILVKGDATSQDVDLKHTDSSVVIHFAATLPNGGSKKDFIINYANAHKLHI